MSELAPPPPSRRFVIQGKTGDLDKAYRVDKDLAAAEAKRLIAMEKRQEDDAYLLSREYDDDYDDQACWW